MRAGARSSRAELGRTGIAMGISLLVGFLLLAAKSAVYAYTGSAAVLSDAAESFVHVAAVCFAAFSLWLSHKPPSESFPYGYERISYVSAGFEGLMIALAAVAITATAIQKWMAGLELQHLGWGTLFEAGVGALNAALGWFLMQTGLRANSVILRANGQHVLTDAWTSFGVVGGLLLVAATGWKPFDPIVAILFALNILRSAVRLIFGSAYGLMDYSDPAIRSSIQESLTRLCGRFEVECHEVKFRDSGSRLFVELHLLFHYDTPLGEAHRRATGLEAELRDALPVPAEIITHLESVEDHTQVHQTPLKSTHDTSHASGGDA